MYKARQRAGTRPAHEQSRCTLAPGCFGSLTEELHGTNVAMAGRAPQGLGKEETRVIFASSLGTVFEWYDFYLYATLAPFFAAIFFPTGNATAALLSAFATYAAGFLVRPFGALVFGRVGDLVGRKYTFLVTILVMGFSTFAVGLLPTFATVGWLAPILLVTLRLLQGLALGGEYGGAATYVAEHAAPGRRGYDTAWIQTTATLGFFLSLAVIGICRFGNVMTPADFAAVGLADSLPGLPHPADLLRLHPAEAQRVADLPEDEGRGQGLQGAADRQLPQVPEQQVRAARAARRHCRPGCCVVHGPVLRTVLPHDHAAGGRADRVHADRDLALAGHAVLHLLGRAVRQDRPTQDHPGRLHHRGTHLLPAVPGAHALRKSCARDLRAEESDHGDGQGLRLSRVRDAVHEVHRLRPGEGLPDQGRAVLQVHRSSGGVNGERDRQDRRQGSQVRRQGRQARLE